jgi:hypothetical protein
MLEEAPRSSLEVAVPGTPTTTVTVTAPTGGTFTAGQPLTVQWDTQGPVGAHAVLLSLDNGQSYTKVTDTDLPGSARSFTFSLPNPASPAVTARVRVAAKDAPNGTRLATGDSVPFSLQQAPTTTVTVTAPTGGTFTAGQPLTVQWDTQGPVGAHAVLLSLDNGQSYTKVTDTDLPGSARSFTFSLPNPASPAVTARVRVAAKDAPNGTRLATGDSVPFSLQQAPTTTVTVTAPTGGTFTAGQPLTVQWDTQGPVSFHTVRLSLDGGPFTNVTPADLDGNARSFTWTLPNPPSSQVPAMVEVAAKDASGKQVGRGDSKPFTIRMATAPAPIITSVAPNRCPLSGGTSVTIAGQNFVEGCRVKFGGIDASRVRFVDRTALIADTPPQAAADEMSVRVINPDGQKFTLENGFRYDSPPIVHEVSPNAGPAQQVPNSPQVVSILGAFFQPGAAVSFGQKTAEVVRIAPDGMLIDVKVPVPAAKGKVPVTVRNVDGQAATLQDGFTYLGPKQAARPRITKVTPLTVLENTTTPVTLRGLNLKQAFDQGLIVVRGPGPDVAQITISEGAASSDPTRLEDTVTFKLQVTVRGGLGLAEQLTLLVCASLRPHAADDLLLEGNCVMLSVVSRTLPVPFGFTAKLVNGGPNLVMAVGRNMKTAQLEVWQDQTLLGISDQQASDEFVLGTLDVNADPTASFSLRVLDTAQNNRVLGTYKLGLEPSAPATTMALAGTHFDPNVARVDLQPADDRKLVGSPSGTMSAVNVKTGAPLGIGMPQLRSKHLRAEVVNAGGLQLASITIQRTLFEGAYLLPSFARPQEGLIDFSPINIKVGKVFSIQALTLLLFVRVDLQVQISVAVVPVLDPFDDLDFPDPFNDFSRELPSRFADYPGAIIFAIEISISARIALNFLLGLIKPKKPGQAQEPVQVLAAAGVAVTVSDRGFELDAGLTLSARIQGVTPLGGSRNSKVRHLVAGLPVPDEAGYRGFYFAESAGQACLPWQFDVVLIKTFRDGGREELPYQFKVSYCLIPTNPPAFRTVLLEPSSLALANGQQATIVAKDDAGNRLTVTDQVMFELDPAGPPIATVQNQDAAENALVTASPSLKGLTRIRALVSTRRSGFALLPSPDLIFEVDRFVARGELPRCMFPASLSVGSQVKAEIEINNTPETRDDIVQLRCEIPSHRPKVPCRVRIVGTAPSDVTVVLTNPDRRLRFPDVGDTMRTLTLAANGTWLDFEISGELASDRIGDAVIEAHQDATTGPMLASKPVTVFSFDQAKINITPGGNYSLTGGVLTAVGGHGVDYAAQARIRPGGVDCAAPQVKDLRIGIAQDQPKQTRTLTWDRPEIAWSAGVAPGTMVIVPATIRLTIDVPFTTHDCASCGTPLYEQDPASLKPPMGCAKGAAATSDDTPALRAPASLSVPAISTIGNHDGTVTYRRLVGGTMDLQFITWTVVYDTLKQQICTLRQRGWALSADISSKAVQRATADRADAEPTVTPAPLMPTSNEAGNQSVHQRLGPVGPATITFTR